MKKSATFQLLSRDTSDLNYTPDPSDDRVFVRVENNGYALDSFTGDGVPKDDVSLRNLNLIFADAPEDSGGDYVDGNYDSRGSSNRKDQNEALPDHVRKEILELRFPDDGYDYLNICGRSRIRAAVQRIMIIPRLASRNSREM